jgi:hypothetical protein
MKQTEQDLTLLLVEMCEELLPNTRVTNNQKIKNILKGIRALAEQAPQK